MIVDLEKLSPAPWELHWCDEYFEVSARGYLKSGSATPCHFYHGNKTDAEFIALARAAFDVMMRRGWFPLPLHGKWYAAQDRPDYDDISMPVIKESYPWQFDDPFTALVEAEKWFVANFENVEAKG